MKDINNIQLNQGQMICCKIKVGAQFKTAIGFIYDTNGHRGDGMLVLSASIEDGSTTQIHLNECIDVEVIDFKKSRK